MINKKENCIEYDFTLLFLGEEVGSFGYGGTGKSSTNCKFSNYGTAFAVGDTVTAYLVKLILCLKIGMCRYFQLVKTDIDIFRVSLTFIRSA